MIDLSLSAGERNVQQMLHWFARNELRPAALECDRTKEVPEPLLRKLRVLSAGGGLADGVRDRRGDDASRSGKASNLNRLFVVAAEEMAWGDAAIFLSMPGPGLGGPPIRTMGTEAQRRRFLGIFSGDALRWGAYALTEPGAGSDVAGIRTRCVQDGDTWVIDGTKCFITNGARASWVVVFATVDPQLGRAGHRVFVVERGTPGMRVGRIEDKMGLRASETAELIFEGCRVPEDNLLGGPEHYRRIEGFKGAMHAFNTSRPIVAAMAVGIGRAAWERARELARANTAWNHPSAAMRRLRQTLAHHARRLHAARLLCWKAAWMADVGRPNAKEAAMAKAMAAQVAMQVCADAVAVAAAVGAAADPWLDKWFRDIKVFDIFEGTGQIQRIVIARRIIEGLGAF